MKVAVIHRTKHDSKARRKTGKQAKHPAMEELTRMIEAGDVGRERAFAHLARKA